MTGSGASRSRSLCSWDGSFCPISDPRNAQAEGLARGGIRPPNTRTDVARHTEIAFSTTERRAGHTGTSERHRGRPLAGQVLLPRDGAVGHGGTVDSHIVVAT